MFINNTLTNIKEKIKIKIKSYSYAKYTHRYNASKQNTDYKQTHAKLELHNMAEWLTES